MVSAAWSGNELRLQLIMIKQPSQRITNESQICRSRIPFGLPSFKRLCFGPKISRILYLQSYECLCLCCHTMNVHLWSYLISEAPNVSCINALSSTIGIKLAWWNRVTQGSILAFLLVSMLFLPATVRCFTNDRSEEVWWAAKSPHLTLPYRLNQ